MKKMIAMLAILTLVGAMLTGCMTGGNVGDAPEPTADFMPMTTNNAASGASNGSVAAENNTRFDWKRDSARIEAQINRISEIAESRVVVTDDTALVGVKFDSAYQGEMTERIREMIAGEVKAADPQITTVAVTAFGDDVEDIYELADKMVNGRDLDDLKEEVSEIVRNATTLR